MFKKFIAVTVSMTLLAALAPARGYAAAKGKTAEKKETSKAIANQDVIEASSAAAKAAAEKEARIDVQFKQTNNAIADLNYKIEYLNSRNNALSKDLDDLRTGMTEQKQSLAQIAMDRPGEERLNQLESEQSLIRADLAQLREDVGVMQSASDKQPKAAPEKQAKEWWQEEWVAPAGFGIGALAFLIAVFKR